MRLPLGRGRSAFTPLKPSPIAQPRNDSSRPSRSGPKPAPTTTPSRGPLSDSRHHSPSSPARLISSHSQRLSADAVIEYSGDQAGPTCSSENGTLISPACKPQPLAELFHSLRTNASTTQGS